MNRRLYISVILLMMTAVVVSAQSRSSRLKQKEIEVRMLNLVGGTAATLNPVMKDSILYFSTNKKNEVLVNHLNEEDGSHLYQIYSVPIRNGKPYGTPKPFMAGPQRPFNQVAIAFDADGKLIVTQNNIEVKSNRGAVLGLYEYSSPSQTNNGSLYIWQPKGRSMAYPTFSEDGKLMIFTSDMSGGEGSADLYYCELKDGSWTRPVNMGSVINTPGVETSPYIHSSGKIFFSSNGRSDSRKLDLYYCFRTEDGFTEPVRYDGILNSTADDYGVFISDDEKWGYFTSTRHGYEHIYYFRNNFPEFPDANEWEEESYCYEFYEESVESYDPNEFSFKWRVSDGTERIGMTIDHCFAGPGEYTVTLSVLDKTSGEEMFNLAEFPLELVKPEQININGKKTVLRGETITYSADSKNISKFTPSEVYYWVVSSPDGDMRVKGPSVTVDFSDRGEYTIKCGTINVEDSSEKLATYIKVTID